MNILHLLGGVLSAIIVIMIGRYEWRFGSVMGLAVLSGFIVNGLWEFCVDYLHWLPIHDSYFDIMDIIRGGIGSCLAVIVWVIIGDINES